MVAFETSSRQHIKSSSDVSNPEIPEQDYHVPQKKTVVKSERCLSPEMEPSSDEALDSDVVKFVPFSDCRKSEEKISIEEHGITVYM